MNKKILICLEISHCLSSNFSQLEFFSLQVVIYLVKFFKDEAENGYEKASSHVYTGLYLHYRMTLYICLSVKLQAVNSKLTA